MSNKGVKVCTCPRGSISLTCPAHPAGLGHRFKITFSSAGSYSVVGVEGHHDVQDWSEDRTVEVRAWNLHDALRKAAELPFSEWFPYEDEDLTVDSALNRERVAKLREDR